MRKKKWPYSIPGRYEAEHDFNFRNPQGPAEALFQTGLFEDQAFTLTNTGAMAQKKILKKYRPILKLIHDGYFQMSADFKTRQSLLLKAHSLEFLALNGSPILSGEIASSAARLSRPAFTDPVRAEIEDLDKKLEYPSPTCTLFQDAAAKGKVGPYLGLKFQIKPGEAGSRPGETGSRPGETVSRPATEVKPCLFLNQLQ